MNELELTGRARTHIIELDDPRCGLHRDVVEPFLALRAEAARAGIDLWPYSGFRDFEAQVQIWNRKFRGERTLYDRAGRIMNAFALDEAQRIDAILAWSALPGASRHHWGSEIDVIDRAALPTDYRAQLLPDEFAVDGVFRVLAGWMGEHLERFDFFRPYDRDRGGVAPEPWHISYAPVSRSAQSDLSVAVIARALETAEFLGLKSVLAMLPTLHRQYVANVGEPPAVA